MTGIPFLWKKGIFQPAATPLQGWKGQEALAGALPSSELGLEQQFFSTLG